MTYTISGNSVEEQKTLGQLKEEKLTADSIKSYRCDYKGELYLCYSYLQICKLGLSVQFQKWTLEKFSYLEVHADQVQLSAIIVSIFAGIGGLKYKLRDTKSWLMNGFISGYVAGVETFGIH